MTTTPEKKTADDEAPTQMPRPPLAPMPRERPEDDGGDFANEAGPLATELGTDEAAEKVKSTGFDGD